MAKLRYAVKSDVGKSRELNEDNYLVKDNVFAVADGMGGHQAGEVASELALQASIKNLPIDHSIPDQLKRACKKANSQVLNHARKNMNQFGMGTTLSMTIIDGDDLWIGHIGDSRVYLYSGGKLSQLTDDHTLVAHLLKNGEISEEEAQNHPKKNVITKAIGSQLKAEPDIFSVKIRSGDKVILCSDGLTGMIDDEEITAAIKSGDPDEAVEELVARADTKGGLDNITVIVVSIDSIGVKKKRSFLRGWAVNTFIGVLLISVLFFGASFGLKSVYFLGEHDNKVAIYQGLPFKVGNYTFYDLSETSAVSIDRLPDYYRKRMDSGIVVGGLVKAKTLLSDIASLEFKD